MRVFGSGWDYIIGSKSFTWLRRRHYCILSVAHNNSELYNNTHLEVSVNQKGTYLLNLL